MRLRWRPLTWWLLSVMFFVAAFYFWRLGDEWAKKKESGARSQEAANSKLQTSNPKLQTPSQESRKAEVAAHGAVAGNLNVPPEVAAGTNGPMKESPLAHRLSNTTRTLKELVRREHALLLENALLDTERRGQAGGPSDGLPIPAELRAQGDPGSYIVQSRTALNEEFRALLKGAGASVVAYIPNNAYLVRASAAAARTLEGNPQTQTVEPYEPYFKLKPGLLSLAVGQLPLPPGSVLNVLLFPDAREGTLPAL